MNILHTECSLNWGGQEYRTLLEHLFLNANGHKSWLMRHAQSKLYRKAIEMRAPNVIALNLRQAWRLDVALIFTSFAARIALMSLIRTAPAIQHCVFRAFYGVSRFSAAGKLSIRYKKPFPIASIAPTLLLPLRQ